MLEKETVSTSLKSMVASIEDWIWETDANGIYTFCGPQCETILGYTPEEMLGKTPFHFMPPDEAKRVGALFSSYVEQQSTFHFLENLNLHKDGTEVLLETSGRPFFDSAGRFCGYRGVDRDITARETSNQMLNTLSRNIHGVIFRYTLFSDGRERIDNIGPGCQLIWELSPEIIKNDPKLLWSQVHPHDVATMRRALNISRQRLENWDHTYRVIVPSGRIKWLRGVGTPALLPDNAVSWTSVVTDVTDSVVLKDQQLKALKAIVRILSKAVASRDPYTANHESRVTAIATDIAVEMGLDETRAASLELASEIHDVGKIRIPSEILSKPGKLTDMEFELIKTHPDTGADFLNDYADGALISEIIRQHHERIDGSGYPAGLAGDEILLEARIVGVADTIEAMSSHRPYRAALGMQIAVEEIERGAGIIYDKDVAEVALSLIAQDRFPAGSFL